jgi:hypothetical protein
MRRKHVDVLVVFAVFAVCVLLVFFAGCALLPEDYSERTNRTQLKDSIDKPYAQVIKLRQDFREPPAGDEALASGRRIVKHVAALGEPPFGPSGSYAEQRQYYRVVYYLVDEAGTVKDWATAVYKGGKMRCWGSNCLKFFKDPPVETLDEVVRTSSGKTIAAWRVEG